MSKYIMNKYISVIYRAPPPPNFVEGIYIFSLRNFLARVGKYNQRSTNVIIGLVDTTSPHSVGGLNIFAFTNNEQSTQFTV